MPIPRSTSPARLPLALFKSIGYIAAAILFAGPLAGWESSLAAAATVPLAFVLCSLVTRYHIRTAVSLSSALLVFAVGLGANRIIGASVWLPRLLSIESVLSIGSAATFGLLLLPVIFVLRLVASRRPMLALLEPAAVMAVVVSLFAAHRDSNISQPRFFADWALGAGYEPRLVLLAIGFSTAAVMVLMLLQTQRGWQTLTALLLLLGLGLAGFALLVKYLPEYGTSPKTVNQTEEDKPEDKQQKKENEPDHKSQDEPDHGDGQIDRDSMSFAPKDWPNHPKAMAVVTLHDDYQPPAGYFYFRQNAYSRFNGAKLVRAIADGTDADVPRDFPQHAADFASVPFDEQLEQLVPMTISLIRPHARPPALTNVQSLAARQNADPKSFERTYDVKSQALRLHVSHAALAGRAAGDPRWSAADRAGYLELPADPRYKELAEQILATVDRDKLKPEFRNSPAINSLAVRRWIEKNMVYSLQADHSRADDPVASFLFGDRRGYCVHVAHAMTYLLRSVGIPARVGAGYAVDAGRPGLGSSILLQCTDLHAWCEVYLDGVGWVVMDAALEQSESPAPPPADLAAQSFYGELNRPKIEVAEEETPTLDGSNGFARTAGWFILALILASSLYAVKSWRLVIPRFAPDGKLYRLCYRAVVDRLAEVGLVRQFGETREEFAQRVAAQVPELVALTESHVRRATGGVDTRSRHDWLDLEARATTRIRVSFGRSRRLAGRLNPFTWMGVH